MKIKKSFLMIIMTGFILMGLSIPIAKALSPYPTAPIVNNITRMCGFGWEDQSLPFPWKYMKEPRNHKYCDISQLDESTHTTEYSPERCCTSQGYVYTGDALLTPQSPLFMITSIATYLLIVFIGLILWILFRKQRNKT